MDLIVLCFIAYNNINQIAVKANAKGFVDTASYWENVRWLKETVSKLMEVIYL